MPTISQRSVDRIIEFEVSSRAYYERKFQRPDWPGESSGPTVGIGYDLGQCSSDKIRKDWSGLVTPEMLDAMVSCSGKTGEAGRAWTARVRSSILIPWDAATKVFLNNDVPEFTNAVVAKIPATANLPADCLGALVSLAFNRGAAFDHSGDRYAEMRAIKQHTQDGKSVVDPSDLRAMKRLWPNVKGLRDRREIEAQLFEDGLKTAGMVQAPSVHVATETPSRTMPAPAAGAKEHGAAAGAIATTAAAANDAAQAGLTHSEITILVIAGIAVAAVLWLAIRTIRKQLPTLARAKDAPQASQGA